MPQNRASKDIAGWLLLATIAYAPWAYGCTRPWTIVVLDILMGAICLAWLLERIYEKRMPSLPKIMLLAASWLCFQGWCMAANGHFLYDREAQMFTRNPSGVTFLPGAVDTVIVSHVMWRYSGLLATTLIAADLALQVAWRRRIIQAMTLTGLSIVLLAYAQKLGGARTIFWETGQASKTFFGTYSYHGNAGAFINLVLPLLIGRTFLSIRNEAPRKKIAFWAIATYLVTVAAFVNISKAGMALTILLLIMATIGLSVLGGSSMLAICRRHKALPVVVGFLIVFPIFISSSTLRWRWAQFFNQIGPDYPRLLMAEISAQMIPDAGFFGFGPGTFQFTFSHYATADQFPGVWTFAHQDYLQTLIEWGYIGATGWGFLLFGALVIGCSQLGRYRETSTTDHVTLFCLMMALVSIALHGLGDFPFQIASLQLYSAIITGMCWSAPSWMQVKVRTKRQDTLICPH